MEHNITTLLELLAKVYPDPKSELVFTNPYEALVATMLSAQCTDKRVNQVTPTLFARFPTVEALSFGPYEEIAHLIRSINFFPTKAKHLLAAAKHLMDVHQGEIPKDLDALTALPGVGVKTASVVLANAFGIPALAVDTHIHRVANRLGLVATKTAEQTRRALMQIIPSEFWIDGHHLLILHGRYCCKARCPACERCPVQSLCRWHRSQN